MEFSEKNYFYLKPNVLEREYRIYKYLNNLNFNFIPKLYNYDKTTKILKIQKINGLSVSDFYGEKFENVPPNIIKQIRSIIYTLYNIGIIYPDITGYNFIQDNNSKIWIVDFEHCFYVNHHNTNKEIVHYNEEKVVIEDKEDHIDFVIDFCIKNKDTWNPYFA